MYKVSTIIYKFLHYIMKVFLHVAAYILVIVIELENICAKSVREGESKFRDDNEVKLYPIKRKSPNYEQSYYVVAHEEQPDVEYSDTLSNLESVNADRYRRVDDQSSNNLLANNLQLINDYKMKPSSFSEKQMDLRRQAMQNGLVRRADRLSKRDMESLPLQSDDSYGMVYRKGRLVGILEPFPTAYELSPLSNVREGIEEIHPLPMTGNRLAPLDPRYSTNRFISDKQANGDWNMKPEGSPEPIKYADEKAPVTLNNYKRDSKADGINSYKRDSMRNGYSTDKDSENTARLKSNDQISKMDNAVGKEEKSNLVMPNSQYNRDSELQYSASPELSESKPANDVKRSISGITNEKISELKLALNRIQNPDPSDRVAEIEEDLRNILNDMGLIDSDRTSDSLKNKRSLTNKESAVDKKQVDKEDENLEQGVNRIEIVKSSHDVQKSEREKREETKDSQLDTAKSAKASDQETLNNDSLESTDDDNSDLKADNNSNSELDSEKQSKEAETVDDNSESIEKKRGASKINVADYQSEGASYIRSKRQESSTSSNDIMKGLEKSGDLTVSGNKSPLASSENGPDAAEKHSASGSSSTTPGPRSPNPDLSDAKYESEIERNLQAKIDAIKEEVKREIAALQSKNSVGEKETQENQRKKRDAPITLLEEETSALNPQEHPEEKLVPLIRRRRNLENPVTLKRSKRSLPDYSNLRNMDSGDYLELNENKKREQRDAVDYQSDTQEGKYLPQNVQISNENSDNSNKEKRNSGATQQDNLIEADAVNSKVDNQENADSQENVARVSERSAVDSSNSNTATLNNENSAKEVNVINKHEENSDSVVDKAKKNANTDSNSFGTPESSVQIQKKTTNNDNSKLLENQGERAQDDVKKRVAEKIPTKEIIESLANKQFNAELRKLNADSEKDDQKSEKGKEKKPGSGLKSTQVKQVKRSEDGTKNEKSEMKTLSTSASTNNLETQEKSKRAIQNLAVAPINSENKESQKSVEDSRRRRRQLDEDQNQNKRQIIFRRKKRANALLSDANVAYVAYRPEEDDVDDEGDEFDDDGFDDRTASMQKREVNINNDNYDSLQDYDSPEGYYNYQPEQRKSSLARRYVSRLNSDLYENPSPGYVGNYLYHPDAYIRRKRQNNFNQLVALHGGGQIRHHIAAMKERNERFAKQNYKSNHASKEEAQNIADLSDTDLFGALPQSYEGELSRFKRIKRVAEDVNTKQ